MGLRSRRRVSEIPTRVAKVFRETCHRTRAIARRSLARRAERFRLPLPRGALPPGSCCCGSAHTGFAGSRTRTACRPASHLAGALTLHGYVRGARIAWVWQRTYAWTGRHPDRSRPTRAAAVGWQPAKVSVVPNPWIWNGRSEVVADARHASARDMQSSGPADGHYGHFRDGGCAGDQQQVRTAAGRPLASGTSSCRAHPGADEGQERETEGEEGVFGVVVGAAGLVAGEEGRQLVGGLNQVEDADDGHDDAERDE